MNVRLDHTEDIAQNIRTFWFAIDTKNRQKPGQFIELIIPHDNADKRGIRRWFTLSSSPSEKLVSITTKFAAENGSSFKAALREVKPGTVVEMASPMGDFTLPRDKSIPLVFIAGGIGVTPFRSMVKNLQDAGEQRDVILIYAANAKNEVAFVPIFKQLGNNFKAVIGDRLTAERILQLSHQNDDQLFYLSGPKPMVDGLKKTLTDAGVKKSQLRADFFPGYSGI